MELKDVLLKLDPKNDTHWTDNGAPAMKAIEEIVGDKSITRKMVTDIAPHFNREHPSLDLVPDEAETSSKEESAYVPPIPDAVDEPAQDTDLDKLLEAQKEANAKVEAIEKGMDEGRKLLLEARTELEQADKAVQDAQPSNTNQDAIMNFIASQNQIRHDNAMRHRQFIEQGFDPNMVGPSTLDKAMARKNTRGTERPTFNK